MLCGSWGDLIRRWELRRCELARASPLLTFLRTAPAARAKHAQGVHGGGETKWPSRRGRLGCLRSGLLLLGLGLLGLLVLFGLRGLEELVVVLLGLDEGVLEEVGIWTRGQCRVGGALCSREKGAKPTLGVTEADGQSDSLGLALADIGGGVPDPGAVGADVGG